MVSTAIRPTRVAIDLDALRHNAERLQARAATGLYAVVKADAYGHGAAPVARALAGSPAVAGFAVSLVEEGIELREAGVRKPILVMGPALRGGYEEIVAHQLLPFVSDPADLEALAALGRRRRQPVAVHAKVDTGMGRLGMAVDQLPALIGDAVARGGVEIVGLATHLACADSDDPSDGDCQTWAQLRQLEAACSAARRAGADLRVVHAANSAATIRFPAARRDLVRVGLALYGNGVGAETGELRQAMRLVSQIAQLRDIPAGGRVSYGGLWRAPHRSRLAVVPIGYGDGYPRRLTGRAEVLIGGRRCPVVGAVCMDMILVDVTALGDAPRVGDEVVLLGSQGQEKIPTSEFAARAGLIEYEVSCGISKRVPRVYG